MPAGVQNLAELLMQFSRLAARAEVGESLLPLLVEAAVRQVGASASAVLKVTPDDELELYASHGLPPKLAGWRLDTLSVDADVGERLRADCDDLFAKAYTLPLMSHQALFGALVLLYEEDADLDEAHQMLAESLVDLAAMTMGRAHQYRELHRAYDELRQSREAQARVYKLGALGQMAAGVSHDLKNILNPLVIYLKLLERQIPDDLSEAQDAIEQMRDVITRGVQTIDRLRDFSRQEPVTDAIVVDINAHVDEAVKLARARLVSTNAYHVALRTELGEPPGVRLVPSELISAVVNLVVNSIDAMQETGANITVSTGRDEEGRAFVRIEDDGPGMPPEVARRVFEPFFTTKGETGTGLGLANVYAFARRHGGDVALDTAPGQGACFTITFPVAEA